jgi:outer membrane lipoprotein-sorting protein
VCGKTPNDPAPIASDQFNRRSVGEKWHCRTMAEHFDPLSEIRAFRPQSWFAARHLHRQSRIGSRRTRAMRSGVRLLFPVLACVLSAIHAQLCWAEEASAESLLKDAAGKIRDLDSYTVEFVRYDESDSSRSLRQQISLHRRISFLRPSRFRIEDLEPTTLTDVADGKVVSRTVCEPATDVFNGNLRLTYNTDLKQFSKMGFDPHKEDPALQFALHIRDQLDEITFGPNETLSISGRQYDCTVIRGHYRTGTYLTVWIDKPRGFIIKFTASQPQARTTTVELISIEANAALREDLFTFEPPASWDQISSFRCSPDRTSM